MLTKLDEIWTEDGIFHCKDSIPLKINCKITIPSILTAPELAALIEITGRIALHVLEIPESVYREWFIEDSLDDPMSADGIQMVVGYRGEWLREVLGSSVEPLLSKLETLPRDCGVLAIIHDGSCSRVIITGNSEYGLVAAARYLASKEIDTCLEATDFIVIPYKEYKPVPNMGSAIMKKKSVFSLHNIFTVEGVYNGTTKEDVLPVFSACFSVDTTKETAVAYIQLVGRLVAGASSAYFPLTVLPVIHEEPLGRLVLRLDTDPSVTLPTVILPEEKNLLLLLSHSVSDLEALVDHVTSEWIGPARDVELKNWRSKLAALTSTYPDIKNRALWDISLYNQITSGSHLRIPRHLWPIVRDRVLQLSVVTDVQDESVVWKTSWKDDGELADIERHLVDVIEQFSEQNTITNLEIFTSVSRESFERWKQNLHDRLQTDGHTNLEFVYRNVHKAGWNWATTSVLPEMKHISSICSVDIQARRFVAENKHLDLPQRFLQELFPIDVVIQKELGISIDDIHLGLADGNVPMFQITARNAQGNLMKQWVWEGMVEHVPYVPSRPELGHICIPVAGFRIFSSSDTEQPVITCRVPTNIYRFWKWYQYEVVAKLPDIINEWNASPKFLRMECDVSVDADEETLSVHQECNSAPEALQEDIYFYALHALAIHGKEVGDPGWSSPGAIVPLVHCVSGTPSAEVIVYATTDEHGIEVMSAGIRHDIQSFPEGEYDSVRVVKVVLKQGQPKVELVGHKEIAALECWMNEWTAGGEGSKVELSSQIGHPDVDRDIWQNRHVIDYLENHKHMLPGQVLRLDRSYLGEWIYAVELSSPYKSYISQTKSILYKPTVFINARHHANEISSTNAVISLISRVIADPNLLNRVNLVIIPLQNVDGAALHERLIKEHPYWKHHAARFNACGYEFAWDYFKQNTPFGESRTYQRIWEKWKPDIVMDDHGIPSHEWIQPFAGWNSPPQFPISYWIPIARIYTIWHELVNANSERAEMDQSMRKTITNALDADVSVRSINNEFLKRYIRWGHNFVPEVFPVEVMEGTMTYVWRTEANPHSHEMLARFPQWITADIVTEVNDETVDGDALAAVAMAHTRVHKGLLEWVSNVKPNVNVKHQIMSEGFVRVSLERQRPLTHSCEN